MPPKKSDGTRRSDISVARFVVADEDTAMATGEPILSANPASALAAAAIERDEQQPLPPTASSENKQSTPAPPSASNADAVGAGNNGRAASITGSIGGATGTGGGSPTSPSDSKRGKEDGGSEKDKEKEREREREREKEREAITIEDLTLPKSIITRLAKGVLPSNTQIQANAILAMTKSATVFISHLANAYVYFCQTIRCLANL